MKKCIELTNKRSINLDTARVELSDNILFNLNGCEGQKLPKLRLDVNPHIATFLNFEIFHKKLCFFSSSNELVLISIASIIVANFKMECIIIIIVIIIPWLRLSS